MINYGAQDKITNSHTCAYKKYTTLWWSVSIYIAWLNIWEYRLGRTLTAYIASITHSRIAGPMCPVLDPAMVTTVHFFHGNEFYMARRSKLAWLLLARHWAFLGIQDGGRHHLRCGTFSTVHPDNLDGRVIHLLLGLLVVWSQFLELFFGYLVNQCQGHTRGQNVGLQTF